MDKVIVVNLSVLVQSKAAREHLRPIADGKQQRSWKEYNNAMVTDTVNTYAVRQVLEKKLQGYKLLIFIDQFVGHERSTLEFLQKAFPVINKDYWKINGPEQTVFWRTFSPSMLGISKPKVIRAMKSAVLTGTSTTKAAGPGLSLVLAYLAVTRKQHVCAIVSAVPHTRDLWWNPAVPQPVIFQCTEFLDIPAVLTYPLSKLMSMS